MILAYPSPWNGTAPHYLVTGDKAFYIQDAQTSHNMQKVGVPLVPFTSINMKWILEKLDPQLEHPLTAFDPDPILDPDVIDGGNSSTVTFLNEYSGGAVDGTDITDDPIDGGSL
jgi:hypothetical protein